MIVIYINNKVGSTAQRKYKSKDSSVWSFRDWFLKKSERLLVNINDNKAVYKKKIKFKIVYLLHAFEITFFLWI